MFELTVLLINIILMALYLGVHPFLSITFKDTIDSEELRKYHKSILLKLMISWGMMVSLFALVIYTASTYLPLFITATLIYMYIITLRGITHYRKHKKPKTTKTTETVTAEESVTE